MLKDIPISKGIIDFYNQSSEEHRLSAGLGPLEFERNKDLIRRYLSKKSCRVVDVGGGTGKYAAWLAQAGHQVWMVDPVPKHLALAQKRSNKLKNKFEVLHGEARRLDFEDDFADLVIMHGPLYHLQEKEERLNAITEAKRITRPGGAILGFAINYAASTLVGLLQGIIHEQEIFNMCHQELTTGMHNAPESIPGILAEAYYHKPEELKAEFEECNLFNLKLFAVEGMIWLDKNFFSSRGDQKKNENLLKLIRITENDINLISFSPHMMVAAIKQ